MTITLQITDGTTTIDLTDASGNYWLQEWAPAVSRRRRDRIGGGPPLAEVEETLNIAVSGSSTSAALSNLDTLTDLLEQANRWADGQNVSAVILKWQPYTGATTYQSTIVNVPDDGVTYPSRFNTGAAALTIEPVGLRFVRIGAWLGGTDNQTSSTSTIPAVQTVTFGSTASIPSPFDATLELIDVANGISRDMPDSFTVFGSDSDRIVLVEAEDLTGRTGYSTAGDTTNDASGGEVLRYDPPNTSANDSFYKDVSSLIDQDARHIAFFGSFRNNSSTASFNVRVLCSTIFTFLSNAETRWTTITTSVSNPTWQYIGDVALPTALQEIELEIQATSTSGTLDIDTLALVAMDDDAAKVIARYGIDKSGGGTGLDSLEYKHRSLTDPEPLVAYTFTTDSDMIEPYSGDAYLTTVGNKLSSLFLACGAFDDLAKWRLNDLGGNTAQIKMDVTRRLALLTPE